MARLLLFAPHAVSLRHLGCAMRHNLVEITCALRREVVFRGHWCNLLKFLLTKRVFRVLGELWIPATHQVSLVLLAYAVVLIKEVMSVVDFCEV